MRAYLRRIGDTTRASNKHTLAVHDGFGFNERDPGRHLRWNRWRFASCPRARLALFLQLVYFASFVVPQQLTSFLLAHALAQPFDAALLDPLQAVEDAYASRRPLDGAARDERAENHTEERRVDAVRTNVAREELELRWGGGWVGWWERDE